MVEPADLEELNDPTELRRLHLCGLRRVLPESKVRPASVVVVEIARHNPSKVSFVQDDHVVEAVAADRANQTFHEWRLPGAPGCDEDLFDSHVVHTATELAAVDPVAVSQEVSGCLIPRKTRSTIC